VRKPILFGLLISTLTVAVHAEVEIDRSITADHPHSKVDVLIRRGSIKVIGWNQKIVKVTGTLGDRVEQLELRRRKPGTRKVYVRARVPKEGNACEAHLTLHVPRNSDIHIEAVQSPIDISGVTGSLTLVTLSGNISASGPCGDFDASTVHGDISVEAPQSRITVQTAGGSIVVRNPQGQSPINLQTVSGGITLTGTWFRDVSLNTVSGPVHFEGGLLPYSDLRIDTHDGEIAAILPANQSAEFDIKSFKGIVENAFNPEPVRRATNGLGQEQEFIIGPDDAQTRINIDTFSGPIRLMNQPESASYVQTRR